MGPTSPLSVGGGVFELGFCARSGLFSCPGLLDEWSPSAFCAPSLVCAWALNPPNAAAAKAAEPIPRTLLLETPSCMILSFFSSLIACFPIYGEIDHSRALHSGTSKWNSSPCLQSDSALCTGCCDASLNSPLRTKLDNLCGSHLGRFLERSLEARRYVKLDHLCHNHLLISSFCGPAGTRVHTPIGL